jgi:tripartite-type tricarboxylate transporter receptor subunit TctC
MFLSALTVPAITELGLMGAQAADWPARPVTVIVGYAAGGNTDVMARMASRTLSEEFRQSFVVDNRIGAGGALAAAYVAQAAPDGYTLFFAASPQIAIVPRLQKVGYDPIKDFEPVSIFGTGPFILGISAAIPARTLAELSPMRRRARSTTDRAARARLPISPARSLPRVRGSQPYTSRFAAAGK